MRVVLTVVQVEAKPAAAASSPHRGVLGQLNQGLLLRVLTAVRAADRLTGCREDPQHHRAAVHVQDMRALGGVMKVQN